MGNGEEQKIAPAVMPAAESPPKPANSPAAPTPTPLPTAHSLLPRLGHLLLAGVCLAPLVIAATITPSPDGHGSHTQLGMPACGWAIAYGKPCITCGMTTSFAHAVRLDLVSAFQCQPFGLLLAILCGVTFWASLHSAFTGSSLAVRLLRLFVSPAIAWGLALGAAAAWGYKWVTW